MAEATALERCLAWQAAAPYRSVELSHSLYRSITCADAVLPLPEHFVSLSERDDDGNPVLSGQAFASSLEEAAKLALEKLAPLLSRPKPHEGIR